jgi:hypothetical protein
MEPSRPEAADSTHVKTVSRFTKAIENKAYNLHLIYNSYGITGV